MEKIMVIASLAISCLTFIMCLGSIIYVEDKAERVKPKAKEPKKGKGPVYIADDGTIFKPRI